MRKYLSLFLLLFALPCFAQVANQLATISPNGKYLYNSITGKAVYLIGDSPQIMSEMISQANQLVYLQDRASRGYNAIWYYAINQHDQNNAPQDFAGNVPFNGAWFSATEVPAYWTNVDFVIQQASKLGIIVFLQVSYVGSKETGYDQAAMTAASAATMTAYGTFLGNRYKSYNNIVYVLGGDSDLTIAGNPAKLNALGNGIAAADPNHLMTYEACRASCGSQNGGLGTSSITAWTNTGGGVPSWLTLNWIYVQQSSAVANCQTGFTQVSTMPPVMGEDWYELSHSLTSAQIRIEGYQETLSGCYVGRIFGNDAIWSFNSVNGTTPTPTWQNQLSSVGSVGEQYLGVLMNAREHQLLVPDVSHTFLTAGFGSGLTISTLARTSDGQTMIAYIPNGNATTITVNMAGITSASSTVNEWWYNPQTGVSAHIGTDANSGLQAFNAPDGNDWALVLDDAAANLPAPGIGGTSSRPTPPTGLIATIQ